MSKKKISMTIDEDVYISFKNYCSQNGMKVSTKVELLMRDAVKDSSLKTFLEK